jgi:predicted nucleic acid-binding protein
LAAVTHFDSMPIGELIDTGPLVALLSKGDQYHATCVAAAEALRAPYFTAWPVITEAAYLLRKSPSAVGTLLSQLRESKLQLLELFPTDMDGISRLLTEYRDQGFDLADVVLMYLAEREGIEYVFTTDRRHFSVFRTNANRALSIIP